MKKQLILGSFLTFATIANSQIYTPSGVIQGSSVSNNVGIGVATPANKLHVVTSTNLDGIRATGPSVTNGNVSLILENNTTGGNTWRFYSLGNGDTPGAGNFVIADNTANRVFINGSTGNVGIGATNAQTQNRLVINKGTANQSGLRFINLTSTSPTSANPGSGVLTVDANGDVIYVAGSAAALGNSCGGTPNSLTSNWEIPLNNRNFIFSGQGTSNYNVGIGTNCTPAAKLEIKQSSGSAATTGLLVTNTDAPNSGIAPVIGIKSLVNNSSSACVKVAGWFEATNAAPGCSGSIIHQALFVPQNGGAVTIGYASPFGAVGALLDVNGAVNINGGGTINTAWVVSDKRFKKEVQDLDNSLDIIMKLKPKSYMFDLNNKYGFNFYDKKQFGFIAQELAEIVPELVKSNFKPTTTDKDGKILTEEITYNTVNYDAIIPFLVKGMQEQQKQIEEQKALINELLKSKSAMPTGINEIKGADGFAMEQNIPNPFSSETVIKYTLTEQTKSSSLVVYDLSGKQVASFPIEKNAASITITSEKLAAGIYIYSIFADGKIIDSKRMVVAQK